jgi:hypothetical protein
VTVCPLPWDIQNRSSSAGEISHPGGAATASVNHNSRSNRIASIVPCFTASQSRCSIKDETKRRTHCGTRSVHLVRNLILQSAGISFDYSCGPATPRNTPCVGNLEECAPCSFSAESGKKEKKVPPPENGALPLLAAFPPFSEAQIADARLPTFEQSEPTGRYTRSSLRPGGPSSELPKGYTVRPGGDPVG